MDQGGVEAWLMHVLRNVDRNQFQMDFMVEANKPYVHSNEVQRLGSKMIPCLETRKPHKYAANFRKALQDHGPYDVIHTHVDHYSGFVLRLAHRLGISTRVAHSHNDIRPAEADAGLLRRLYLASTKRLIKRHATVGLAASEQAAISLYGESWRSDARWRVLHCGVDLTPFRKTVDSKAVRAALGIPEGAFVVGHTGRFVEQKNHTFLLQVFSEIAQLEPSAHLLLVGDGPLLPYVKQQAEELQLVNKVRFTGARTDVPELMLGAMDTFVFPSRFEGLGLVLVEAQAAGLPCLLSDVVPSEADVIPQLTDRLPLGAPAEAWAKAALQQRQKIGPINAQKAFTLVQQSPFNIELSWQRLRRVYGD